MSVQIIEKPKQTCELCGCAYSFGKDAIQRTKERIDVYNDIGLFNRTIEVYKHTVYVDCPVCGSHNTIKTWEEEKRTLNEREFRCLFGTP